LLDFSAQIVKEVQMRVSVQPAGSPGARHRPGVRTAHMRNNLQSQPSPACAAPLYALRPEVETGNCYQGCATASV